MSAASAPGPERADARARRESILRAAKDVLARSGVNAPVREIADEAGVGIATLYRHFPQRADLVLAILDTEIDDVADAALRLVDSGPPRQALEEWVESFTRLVATKKGLAAALRSDDPGLAALPAHLRERILPSLTTLLDRAVASGDVRPDVDAEDLMLAVADLSHRSTSNSMIRVLLDGLATPRPGSTRP